MKSSSFAYGLQAAGVISVLIGLGHISFHRIFDWKRAFASLSVHDAKVLTTIHIGATLFLLLVGVLTLRYSELLSQPTEPASVLCASLSLFWTWRLLWQVTYLKPSPIRHDGRFLALHYVFTSLFAFLVIAYGAPVTARIWSS
jgi:hypothetical protein